MEESEAESVMETLSHQELLMQKLRSELEEEREASASSANEALSMILRLQAEKAAEKMEAWQYKIMTEGKMRHDEESLLIFEDLLYQKDLEIASLKFQVEDFVDKLSDFTKNNSSENTVGSSSSECVRRTSSLPSCKINKVCCQIESSSVYKESEPVGLNSAYSDEHGNKNKAFNHEKSALEPNSNVSENRDCVYRQLIRRTVKEESPNLIRCLEEEKTNDDGDQNPSCLVLQRPKAHTSMDVTTASTAGSMDSTRDIFEVPHYHRARNPADLEFSKTLTTELPRSSSLSISTSKKEIIPNDHQHCRKQRSNFVDSELKQLDNRVGKLEEVCLREEEHMKLLRDIHVQLKLLQLCFTNQNNKNNEVDKEKSRKKKMDIEESFISLTEVIKNS